MNNDYLFNGQNVGFSFTDQAAAVSFPLRSASKTRVPSSLGGK